MIKKIKLLIADDHQLIIDGVRNYLQEVRDIEIVAIAKSGKQVIEEVTEKFVDIVLLDINMPVMNGYDTARLLQQNNPEVKIIAFTTYTEKAIVQKMVEVGVKGYILKNIEREDLIDAIYKVAEGKNYYSSEISLMLITDNAVNIKERKTDAPAHIELTAREKEILKMIAEGMSHAEIGKKLFLSTRTVDTHRSNIIKKLNVKNITELIKYAIKTGLIED